MPTTTARNDQNVLSTRADLGHDLERRGVVESYGNKFSVRGIKSPILISNFPLHQWSRRKISSGIPQFPEAIPILERGYASLRSSFYTLICIDMQRNMLFLRNFFLFTVGEVMTPVNSFLHPFLIKYQIKNSIFRTIRKEWSGSELISQSNLV